MQSNTQAAVLEDLIETLEDGAKGFEQAADLLADGEDAAGLAAEMRDLAAQRRRFSAELRELASEHGFSITEDGSTGGAIHRAWMALKDGATGSNPGAILAAAETGEDHAVSEYQDALEKDLDGGVRDVVVRQAQAVGEAHDRVRSLGNRFES